MKELGVKDDGSTALGVKQLAVTLPSAEAAEAAEAVKAGGCRREVGSREEATTDVEAVEAGGGAGGGGIGMCGAGTAGGAGGLSRIACIAEATASGVAVGPIVDDGMTCGFGGGGGAFGGGDGAFGGGPWRKAHLPPCAQYPCAQNLHTAASFTDTSPGGAA